MEVDEKFDSERAMSCVCEGEGKKAVLVGG